MNHNLLVNILITESNAMFNVDLFVFSDGIIETDEMGLKFLPYPSLPNKGGGMGEGGGKLIPKPNPIFNLYFFVLGNRHIETDQMGTQFFKGMGVRKHLPIARDRFFH